MPLMWPGSLVSGRHLGRTELADIRALLVHAKDETAAGFYAKFGFVPSSLDPLMLLVRV